MKTTDILTIENRQRYDSLYQNKNYFESLKFTSNNNQNFGHVIIVKTRSEKQLKRKESNK